VLLDRFISNWSLIYKLTYAEIRKKKNLCTSINRGATFKVESEKFPYLFHGSNVIGRMRNCVAPRPTIGHLKITPITNVLSPT